MPAAQPVTQPTSQPTGQPAMAGLYLGDLGGGDTVLLTLRASDGQPAQLAASYHHARGWDQQVFELTGSAQANRLTLRGATAKVGAFDLRAQDADTLTGTWTDPAGRRQAVTLTRAASWSTQSVLAKDGVRSCERPRFTEARYERINRELAEACDYFLADGFEGPGTLRMEIDSLGQYMVAAVAYAKSGGRELPPEIIAIDLGTAVENTSAGVGPGLSASVPKAHASAIAARP